MMLRNEFWCVDIRKLTLYARIYEKWSRISHENTRTRPFGTTFSSARLANTKNQVATVLLLRVDYFYSCLHASRKLLVAKYSPAEERSIEGGSADSRNISASCY